MNENALQKLQELTDFSYEILLRMKDNLPIDKESEKGFDDSLEEIVYIMIHNPGILIYHPDPSSTKVYRMVFDYAWKHVDTTYINELIWDDCLGHASLVEDFEQKLVKVKPTFISVNPDNSEFRIYYEEAVKAWVYGLHNSALILCLSILENVMIDRLRVIKPEFAQKFDLIDQGGLTGVSVKFKDLVDSLREAAIINKKQKNTILNIQKLRNNAVHNLKSYTDDEVYVVIQQTKDLVEHLLTAEE